MDAYNLDVLHTATVEVMEDIASESGYVSGDMLARAYEGKSDRRTSVNLWELVSA